MNVNVDVIMNKNLVQTLTVFGRGLICVMEVNKRTYTNWSIAGHYCGICDMRSFDHHTHTYCADCDQQFELGANECVCNQISANEYIINSGIDPHRFFLRHNVVNDIGCAPIFGKRNGNRCCACKRLERECRCAYVCGLKKVIGINGKTRKPIHKKCKWNSDSLKDMSHDCIGFIDLKDM